MRDGNLLPQFRDLRLPHHSRHSYEGWKRVESLVEGDEDDIRDIPMRDGNRPPFELRPRGFPIRDIPMRDGNLGLNCLPLKLLASFETFL